MNLKSAIIAKIFGLSIIAVMVSGFTVYPAFATTATSGDLFFTTFSGTNRLHKVHYTYDGVTTFTHGPVTDLCGSTLPGADGLIFVPGGDLLIGGQADAVHKINPTSCVLNSKTAGGTASFHLALDPSGTKAWSAGIPGTLAEIPLSPFANGIFHPLSGSTGVVTSIAFDGANSYYTDSGAGGTGSFGTIDLIGFSTTQKQSGVPAAHGMSFDPFSSSLILFGSTHISQIKPSSSLTALFSDYGPVAGTVLDQGAVDGQGHIFAADNNGQLIFIDYSASGKVNDPSNFVSSQFLAASLDDVAPIVGLGAPSHPVGGIIIPVDMTSLFIAGAMTNAFWILPTFGGIAGTAITLFKVKRKHN